MSCVLVDYDSGNLHSAHKAFERMAADLPGFEITVTSDPDLVARADRIVLPGDGAFPACRAGLRGFDGLEEALVEAVEHRAVPFMGICVGMQMMARMGHEYQPTDGFGWINGEVRRITPTDPSLKVPHMGWNDLVITQEHPVLAGLKTGDHAYFVHSYAMDVADPSQLLAYVDYGSPVTAIVGEGTKIGTQFHPEKSQEAGLRLISNFLHWTP